MVRKRNTIQFEENDKLFKALIENSWDVTILIDEKARVLYASPSSIRMFGRDYKEFMGMHGIKYIHPLDAPRVAKGLAQILLRPQNPVQMEMRIRHKDGHYLWIEALATNLLADKNVKGIVVNYHDITALKRIEEQKDEFIAIASHELKTPISSLHVYLQIMKTKLTTLSQAKSEEYLEKMTSQVIRLERLVNDLYDAARIREEKLPLKKEKFNILALLKAVAEDTEQKDKYHKIFFIPKYKGLIVADKMRIQQVFANLLSNAVKFSPNVHKIRVFIWEKDKFVFISVTDYGVGISKENVSKITQRFFQADVKSKKSSGLGLGLYIAYNIVKQHGGEFWVKSIPKKSTTITFSLPKK